MSDLPEVEEVIDAEIGRLKQEIADKQDEIQDIAESAFEASLIERIYEAARLNTGQTFDYQTSLTLVDALKAEVQVLQRRIQVLEAFKKDYTAKNPKAVDMVNRAARNGNTLLQ